MKRTGVILFGLIFSSWMGCRVFFAGRHAYNPNRPALNLRYAGVRSSGYGIKPFPSPRGWELAVDGISGFFPGASPCAIWIVGILSRPQSCRLEFPSSGRKHPNVSFLDYDKHEVYLDHFDKTGIKVFLQVEPAYAEVETLIDLVLERYKHHKCVIGFGVDVEWYRESDHPKWGAKVDDHTARLWEARVQWHNPQYRLFLKHWNREWMPPSYRGDIIFVSDSQEFKSFDHMAAEFIDYWAAHFLPNTVFFQIGYPRDQFFWERLPVPPKDIGLRIAQNISQECGIFWVDFTLRKVLAVDSGKPTSSGGADKCPGG